MVSTSHSIPTMKRLIRYGNAVANKCDSVSASTVLATKSIVPYELQSEGEMSVARRASMYREKAVPTNLI